MRLYTAIKRLGRHEAQYFKNGSQEIKSANMDTLLWSCLASTILFGLFVILADIIIATWDATWHYWIMLPALGSLTIASYFLRRRDISYVGSVICANVFCVIMFALMINISVFPYKDDPQVFVSLFIMIVSVLFVLPFWNIMAIILVGATVFVILTLNVQPPNIAQHNIFCTVASVLFSAVLFMFVSRVRLHDFNLKEQYKQLGMTDVLVDCLNRRAFEYAYNQMTHRGEFYTILLIDLDEFKHINDECGHQKGDEMLIQFVERTKNMIRADDILGRVGGDEFCIILSGTKDVECAETVASRVIKSANCIAVNENASLHCSIGICINESKVEYDRLFKMADLALYEAKSKGKNRYEVKQV